MKTNKPGIGIKRRRWLAAIGLAALAVTAVPAQAHTDVAISLGLGAPYYGYAPPPRYYAPTVVYEEPEYYEPAVVYRERYYCPPRRVHYYAPRGYAYGHYRRHRHDWDD